MNNIELVIFDFDGVIADSEHLYTKADIIAFERSGIEMPLAERNDIFIGMSFNQILEILTRRYGSERVEKYQDILPNIVKTLFEKELTAIPNVVEFLTETNLPYYVASNAYSNWTKEKIGMMSIDHLFGDIIIGTDSVKNAKPSPDMFELAAKRAQADYSKCLVVEDGIYGIHAAKQLDMKVVGFTGQTLHIENHHHKLMEAGASLTFDCMTKLPEIIRSF